MIVKLVDFENPIDGKKKDGCLKANFDFKINSSHFLRRAVNSVHFLSPQPYRVLHVSADSACVLREESHHLPVD